MECIYVCMCCMFTKVSRFEEAAVCTHPSPPFLATVERSYVGTIYIHENTAYIQPSTTCRNRVCYVCMYACTYVLNTYDLNHAHKTVSLSLYMYVCMYSICNMYDSTYYEIVLCRRYYIHTFLYKDGESAIDVAKKRGHTDIVAVIENAIGGRRVKGFVVFLHTGVEQRLISLFVCMYVCMYKE